MISIRKMLTIAAASAVLGAGMLTLGAAPAEAKKGKHFHGHSHKGHFHGHSHKWHGHRFHKRFHYVYDNCYWKWTNYGKVKVCPYSPY